MLKRLVLLAAAGGVFVLAVYTANRQPATSADQPIPEMKFNEVKEIAPGVFFRYSSIASPRNPDAPFGGSNHAWVIFKDYVAVIDANFPKEAEDVIAAIKKTTNKPIRYVFDTHHHGDHAYGNAVWAKEGAKIIASKNTARLLKVNGPKQWEAASKDREDLRNNKLKQADLSFDDKYVLDDGTQRIEFIHFGHSHTIGDAVAYLPKQKILCTGDACVNGPFNFMGHSNSASWIRCLEQMDKLDVDIVCPGHGPLASKELLGKQKRYFVDLRAAVTKGIEAKKSAAEIASGLELPWYKEWTGKAAKENAENIEHVYAEMMGKIDHERLGLEERQGDREKGRQGDRKQLASSRAYQP
jgi:glyoxylase-like metal-dependent hydrolase (beta-lactamase superfamily II)